MANSDKNILITPNISAATGVYPTIKFNGANNTPINLSVLDDGTISFSSTAGQLFSISDGLTGTIFSVNDISGIPSIEVLDTGLVKINQYGGSTVFGSSAAIQNASSVNAKVSISTVSATTPGLIIKGVSSQSANLQEWQSSDGTVLSNIGPNGTVTLKSIASANIATFFNGSSGYGAGHINYAGTFNINGANMGFPYTSSGATLNVNAISAGSLPLSVRGYASQTADLQQWQNSAGTVLARVIYNGNIESPIVSAGSLYAQTGDLSVAYGGYFGGGVGGNYIGAAVSVIPWTTTTIGVIVRGRASQTADLQQWQNVGGTVLSGVNTAGQLYLGSSSVVQSGAVGLASVTGDGTNATYTAASGYTVANPFTAGAKVTISGYTGITGYNGTFTISSVGGTSGAYTFTVPNTTTGTPGGTGASYQSVDLSLTSKNPWSTPFVIKAAASQATNLLEFQNSSGTVLSSITASGALRVNSAFSGTQVAITAGSATTIGAVIRGAASQTANLQEWQDTSGTVLGSVVQTDSNNMVLRLPQIQGKSGGHPWISFGSSITNTANQATDKPLVVKGAASQTANLTEWQNSSGTVLAKIAADGSTTFASPIVGFVGNSGSYSSTAVSGYNIIHLSQGMFFINSQTGGDYNLATNSYYNSGWKYFESAGSTLLNFGNGRFDFNTASSGTAGNAITYTSKMIIANSGTVTINGFGAAAQGLIIKGAASQTADLQQWQDSAGTVAASINSGGSLSLSRSLYTSASLGVWASVNADPQGGSTGNALTVQTYNTTSKGIVIAGQASQTANLQEWQNSAGTVLSRVGSNGEISTNNLLSQQGGLTCIVLGVQRNVGLATNNPNFGSGQQVVFIGNSGSVPTLDPTGGGILYVENGALKYRGSSGTVTTIANA